jgi:hypothetical protein
MACEACEGVQDSQFVGQDYALVTPIPTGCHRVYCIHNSAESVGRIPPYNGIFRTRSLDPRCSGVD